MKFWFKQWYEKVDELGLSVREVLNKLYKHYSGAIGTPCNASTVGLMSLVVVMLLPCPPC